MLPAEDEHIKILFPLEPDESGWPPCGVEGIWAIPLELHHRYGNTGRFRIDNIPFFVREIALYDVVTAIRNEDGEWWFEAVRLPSDYSTIRVIVYEEQTEPWLGILTHRLSEDFQCSWERLGPGNLVAVGIPPDTDIEFLFEFMDEGEAAERWTYEVSALRHE